MRRILPILLLLVASVAWAAEKPKLSLVIAPDGTAAVKPVFPGQKAGTVKYRFYAGQAPVFRLTWIDASGWPSLTDYSWPSDFGGVEPGPSPVPVPPPTPIPPTPTPEPTPPTKLWGAVIIEESGARTPAVAAVLASPAVRKYFADADLNLRIADQNANDENGKPLPGLGGYIDRAKKAGKLPRLFIVGDDGRVAYEGDLPGTPEALTVLVQKYMPKGAKR